VQSEQATASNRKETEKDVATMEIRSWESRQAEKLEQISRLQQQISRFRRTREQLQEQEMDLDAYGSNATVCHMYGVYEPHVLRQTLRTKGRECDQGVNKAQQEMCKAGAKRNEMQSMIAELSEARRLREKNRPRSILCPTCRSVVAYEQVEKKIRVHVERGENEDSYSKERREEEEAAAAAVEVAAAAAAGKGWSTDIKSFVQQVQQQHQLVYERQRKAGGLIVQVL
jgi:hypothetical protein